MEEKKVIFSFSADEETCAVTFDGCGQDIVSGLIIMMHQNKDFKQMMIAALDIHEGLDKDILDKIEESHVQEDGGGD